MAISNTSQPANQPTNQPASQPTSQPTSQPAHQLPNQRASQPTSQPAHQPASHPATPANLQIASKGVGGWGGVILILRKIIFNCVYQDSGSGSHFCVTVCIYKNTIDCESCKTLSFYILTPGNIMFYCKQVSVSKCFTRFCCQECAPACVLEYLKAKSANRSKHPCEIASKRASGKLLIPARVRTFA